MKRIFNFCVLLAVMVGSIITVFRAEIPASEQQGKLIITYPHNETLFPRDMFAPTFRWNDKSSAELWRVTLKFADSYAPITDQVGKSEWRPSKKQWETIKIRSLEKNLTVTVHGIKIGAPKKILSEDRITIRTSKDPVGSPIFYRDVPLPIIHALKNKQEIRWRLGDVSTGQSRVVLKDMKTCANCHSFSTNGKFLAMDVDKGNDKGSYAITKIKKITTIDMGDMITWNDYDRKKSQSTFGLLPQISPGGRYIISTVKEEPIVALFPDLYYPQMFFPIKGILAVYDTVKRDFFSLSGADDPGYVQTNAVWSPDGKSIVFSRALEYKIGTFKSKKKYYAAMKKERKKFKEGGAKFRYDLYRIPFNNGKGGVPEPLPGASKNGKSNYFAKFSPDGKWIVFCQADSFMLNQPDSLLYIIPAQGGTPRQMRANTPGRMNSWHSWSPNGKWLVFSSKAVSPYTQLYITHIDEQGNDTPPVLLEGFVDSNRAANIPEFVNIHFNGLIEIRVSKEIAGG